LLDAPLEFSQSQISRGAETALERRRKGAVEQGFDDLASFAFVAGFADAEIEAFESAADRVLDEGEDQGFAGA